jgi:hypothetical protein
MTRSEAGRLGGQVIAKKNREASYARYYASPKHCLQCKSIIEIPPGKRYQFIAKKKFCTSSCAATFNNTQRGYQRLCKRCKAVLYKSNKNFCSHTCSNQFRYEEFIQQWKAGDTSKASTCNGLGISNHIRRYLFDKYDSKCCKCGWNCINPVTGKIPLVVNHIDGHSENNLESNLELICPSCDSLTPTYMALNKGNGRTARYQKKREAAPTWKQSQ